MAISYATLASLVIAVLLLGGILAWSFVLVCGVRQCALETASPEAARLFDTLADRSFRNEHRNHLHFADVCFLGAAAVAASVYLND